MPRATASRHRRSKASRSGSFAEDGAAVFADFVAGLEGGGDDGLRPVGGGGGGVGVGGRLGGDCDSGCGGYFAC